MVLTLDTLLGITAADWWELLRENRFAIDPPYSGRALALTLLSFLNSAYRRKEQRAYGAAVENVAVEAPLFILGHWRSGTTLLHNLLALDEQFAYPNLFQVSQPHSFLSREAASSKKLGEAGANKRPMDNVEVTFRSPGEDEFASAIVSLRSPIIGWSFPRRQDHYDEYLTFRGVPEQEVQRWKTAFVWFLKKLTWRYERPLILKSPVHTGRIRLLLELFPRARFVHIHRHPYTVFQSTQRLFRQAVTRSHLQRPVEATIDEGIRQRYAVMYEAFFAERDLIPAGQFHEICFEELEADIEGQIGQLYERLALPGFQALQPRLQQYLAAHDTYRKNTYPPLAEPLRRSVARAWGRSFEAWGYAARIEETR